MTNNYQLNCEELFDLTNKISPRQRCLNFLRTEAYKCLNGLMNDLLVVSKQRYNTRYYDLFVTDQPKTER